MKSVIFGISGKSLTQEEKEFFKKVQPLGFILFSRNIDTPTQLQSLTSDLKQCVNHDYVPILIDQEGGRVSRLTPPNFREIQKPAEFFAEIAKTDLNKAKELVFIHYYLIGKELSNLGINVDCAPVADMRWEETHEIIGERSFGNDPKIIKELCQSSYYGLKAAGVEPIIKHIPGHGRATSDSHLELPRIDASLEDLERSDFLPFKGINNFKWAMTAHILYTSLDSNTPVTQSAKAISYIRNKLGYSNALITDDINMKALRGSLSEITSKCYDAGCDIILHCSGDFSEMEEVSEVLKEMPKAMYDKLKPNESIIYEEKIAKYISTPSEELETILKSCNA